MSYRNGILESITDEQFDGFIKGVMPKANNPEIALDEAEEELANRGISDENIDIFELLELWKEK